MAISLSLSSVKVSSPVCLLSRRRIVLLVYLCAFLACKMSYSAVVAFPVVCRRTSMATFTTPSSPGLDLSRLSTTATYADLDILSQAYIASEVCAELYDLDDVNRRILRYLMADIIAAAGVSFQTSMLALRFLCVAEKSPKLGDAVIECRSPFMLWLAAIAIADKSCQDYDHAKINRYWIELAMLIFVRENVDYSSFASSFVSGLSTFNAIEHALLAHLDYNIRMDSEQFDTWCEDMVYYASMEPNMRFPQKLSIIGSCPFSSAIALSPLPMDIQNVNPRDFFPQLPNVELSPWSVDSCDSSASSCTAISPMVLVPSLIIDEYSPVSDFHYLSLVSSMLTTPCPSMCNPRSYLNCQSDKYNPYSCFSLEYSLHLCSDQA